MSLNPFFSSILMVALAAPASAAPMRAASSAQLYMRARAAEVAGDPDAAGQGFAALLAREPGSELIAQRAFSEAVAGGDAALAARAARLLERQGALRPDGRLMLAVDAIHSRDWVAARAQVTRVEQEKLFAFLVPMLRAWIMVGARDGDPLGQLDAAQGLALAQPYLAEQRALLMIALGRVEEGVAALRAGGGGIKGRPIRLRLIAADALAATRQKDRALALLDGDEAPLVAARERIAAGKRLPAPLDGPAAGIGLLLVRVANDFGQQQLAPIGITLARLATFLAPDDASGWLVVADLFATLRRPEIALGALDHVAESDPLMPTARALRVGLLTRLGRNDEALAEAIKATTGPELAAASWSRVGDVRMAMNRPAEAAAAYGKAIAAADAAHLPAGALWPLLLQHAAALDGAGDWPAARAALKRAYALAPDEALVLNQVGYAQIARRENVTEASALIERASRLRPDDPAITDSIGWSHYLQGDVKAAVPLLEKASAGDPTEPTINEHLGDAYWSTGRFLEARYAWRAALVTAEDKDKARLSTKIDAGLSTETAAP